MREDSIEGIYDTLTQCALVSKSAGGIGLAVSCIRATGSYIAGVSKGNSAGLKEKGFFLLNLLTVCFFFPLSDEWEVQRACSNASSVQQHSTLH